MASHACVAISLFMLSCGCGRINSVAYSEFADFGNDGWERMQVLDFAPWPVDSAAAASERYDLVLCVRYSGQCRLSSLPLIIESLSLADGSDRPDTLKVNVPLFDKDGRRRGKGPFTVYEVEQPLARDMKLPAGYDVSISNPLDKESTKGIVNIGMILRRSKKTE